MAEPVQVDMGDFLTSIGLWQIHVAVHGSYAPESLFDPAANARAALAIYRNEGWSAWTTYRPGCRPCYNDPGRLEEAQVELSRISP